MKHNKTLYVILAFALLIRLTFAFTWHDLWWDGGVYLGMGKYVFSGGESGLWEHIRPPLLPLALGGFWAAGLNAVLFGRLLEILLMLGVVWLTYQLANHWFGNRTALLSALIVSVSPIFHSLSFHLYTEIPSTFLALLSLWLFTRRQYFLSGIAVGASFLAKFPAGIFLAALLLVLGLRKRAKPALITATGFGIITLPYFAYSFIAHGSPFATLLAARDTIAKVLGCNVLRPQPWWHYFRLLTFSETALHFLAIPGLYGLWKRWNNKHALFALSLALPLLYFLQLHCRDYRYLALFLPFIAILTALGTVWAADALQLKKKQFVFLLFILGVWMLLTTAHFYHDNEAQRPSPLAEEYFTYLQGKNITKELWTANPIVAAHTDLPLHKIYYPVYDANASRTFLEHVQRYHDDIGAVFLDNCGGGIICPPNDDACQAQTQQLITELDEQYTRALDQKTGRCWYRIWTTSPSEYHQSSTDRHLSASS